MDRQLAVSLMIDLVNRASQVAAMIQRAESQGRDFTGEELQRLAAQADAASKTWQNVIKISEEKQAEEKQAE